jgi:hypothetical protein
MFKLKAHNHYLVECWRPGFVDGPCSELVWTEEFDNIVVTQGMNQMLDATLKTGDGSPAWYVGLKDTGSVVAGDTLASHSGWAEINPYSGNRPGFTPGTIASGSVDNSGAKASYSINATDDVYGAFLCDAASGTSGILYGAGDFGAPRSVISGDTLNVQITCSLS